MIKKLSVVFLMLILFFHCRRDVDSVTTDPGAQLVFSEGLVLFDTIFTTVGSTTHRLKVYNPGIEAVNISSITISGDGKAFFRMNVDGVPGSTVNNIFLAGRDSMFVFIDVTIDPDDSNLPFLIEGNIQFITNGNAQDVPLIAYGQQAIFYTPNKFPANLPAYRLIESGDNKSFTWQNDTPIVIYGYLVIDSLQHLTIEPGTQIYLHANAGIWVYRYGQITVQGSKEEPVVFQGDRLDGYKDISGSWDRIWINDGAAGKNNTFDWAIIKNSFLGIQAEHNPFNGDKAGYSENALVITNSIIDNAKFAGIYGLNYNVLAANLLISDCGGSNFYVTGGGFYSFSHCTLANYWRGASRSSPAVYLTNYYVDFEANAYRGDSMVVEFNNCVIYGDQESEFNIENELDPGDNINFTFDHTIVKTDVDPLLFGTYKEAIVNPENTGLFINPYGGNFDINPNSPGKDKGDPTFVNIYPQFFQSKLLIDLDGRSRSDGKPDLGAYESQ